MHNLTLSKKQSIISQLLSWSMRSSSRPRSFASSRLTIIACSVLLATMLPLAQGAVSPHSASRYTVPKDMELITKKPSLVTIKISKRAQRGYYYVDGILAMHFPVSTGTANKPTPAGIFRITQKDRHHRSNLYHNASMPYFCRLTNCGVGMHTGVVGSGPLSHGCIRMLNEAARLVFTYAPMGTEVTVF